MVEQKYNPYISNLFNTPVLKEFASNYSSVRFNEILTKSNLIQKVKKTDRLSQVYDTIFEYLNSHYRSEYIYKNALAIKILLGRHSVSKASILTELRVGSSKADVVILNGTSNVYEIKTELDTLDRLNNQLNSYLQMFDFVNVISDMSQIKAIKKIVKPQVGLLVLSKDFKIRSVRPAKSNKRHVLPETIFYTFRKNEYIKALKLIGKNIPKVPNTQIHKACKKIFSNLSPLVAHSLMVKILSERMDRKEMYNVKDIVPKSLIYTWLVSSLTKSERMKLIELLNTKFHQITNQ